MKFIFSVGLWLCLVQAGGAQTTTTCYNSGLAAIKSEGKYHVIAKDPLAYALSSVSLSPFSRPAGTMYGVNHLPGLFCKLEYKLERKSILAPRFRLGSYAYTEWMEGKSSYHFAPR